MYGLIIEAMCQIIKTRYGENTLAEIRDKAGIHQPTFVTHRVYSESVIGRLTKATQEVTHTPLDELMSLFGESFVPFVDQYGYARILKVLGRNMRDFLNGLDNLHEYLRFTYPKMRPPSFFCEAETNAGLTLHYRSRRKGFLHYVLGQIRAVGRHYYRLAVDVDIVKQEETLDQTHVVMRLHFDNAAFDGDGGVARADHLDSFQLRSDIFFEVFPFHIVFSRGLVIENVGAGLQAVMPDIKGESVDEVFTLVRPLVDFSLKNILMYSNNVFELTSVDAIRNVVNQGDTDVSVDEKESGILRLKGQMMYMEQWDAIIFLGTPLMENLTRMFEIGLYLNDLSMHDSSRDLVLAATQQASELKMSLDQEKVKSEKLEESMRNLDEEMKRTDMLLYQMIPKTVADRLRNGEPAVNTCEVFDHVTILFSDVVGFTKICSQLTPMAVVSMLNGMYTKFDKLSERHRVYKVETIGDAYMVVSGAPTVTKFHAIYISDMAFDMLATMSELIEPSSGKSMQIRIGLHSGMVVAGVVGLKMPRYCLFGETVNTAAKMENSGQAMRIHISEMTQKHLEGQGYGIEKRGVINVEGIGSMKTYWLTSKRNAAKKPGQAATDNPHIPVIQEPNGEGQLREPRPDGPHQSLVAEKKRNISKRITKDAARLSTNGVPPDGGGGGRAPSGDAKKDSLGKPAKICRLM